VGTTTRTARGRFGSDHHPLELYGVVRDVALTAAPDDPTSVSQSIWDGARANAGHEDAPTARAICARLADGAGRPFPWRQLLELVFDEARDIERTHALRMRSVADEYMSEDDVYYALRRVALLELGQSSLKPGEYERERERLLAQARRRRNGAFELLVTLLPTVGQVERIAEDWDSALILAELEPRQAQTPDDGEKPKAEGERAKRPANKPPDYWTLERCVEAVRVYFKDPAAGQHPSRPRYRSWAVGRPDAPSPSAFERYGGWAAVSKLAQRRGAIPPELLVPSQRERDESAVLAYLDEHGQVKNADVQALLGASPDTARRTLNRLRDRGVIVLGSKHATGRSVFYVPADARTAAISPSATASSSSSSSSRRRRHGPA
jgi:hypothetical protein